MRTGGEQVVVDANVILRFLVHDDDELYAKAAAVFKAMGDGRIKLLCDPVLLAEVIWVSASFYKIPRVVIAEGLLSLLRAGGFVVPNKEHYIEALRLYADQVPHFGDACACAAAIEKCDGKLLSFDRRLSAVEGVSRFESADDGNGGEHSA